MRELAWIECDELGCTNGLQIDSRHARNFDGREWYCAEHQEAS